MNHLPLILASSSPNRLNILYNIGIIPEKIISPDIDETPLKKEKPRNLAARLGKLKAEKIASEVENGYVIAADTVSARGNLILPKAINDEDVRYCLNILSGRRHRVYSGVTIIKIQNNQIIDRRDKIVQTIIKFKKLTEKEIESYIKSKEGIEKGGGFSICGIGQIFISFISGSYSNVGGLPLFETRNMLDSLGYDILNR
jgi:septum formation protein